MNEKNNMLINRNNYEEYFILYMDNELSPAQRRMVEDFTQHHPDLREELELLLQSRFEPDTSIVYTPKEELFVSTTTPVNSSNLEEWLVLYIDNELDPSQKNLVEDYLQANPPAQSTHEQLLKSKLIPETISFPDKAMLYRTEKTRNIRWWRLAAAAVLILVAGGMIAVMQADKNNTETGIASGNIKQTTSPPDTAPTTTNIASPATDPQQEIAKTDQPVKSTQDLRKEVKPSVIKENEPAVANKGNLNNLPAPVNNPNVEAQPELSGLANVPARKKTDLTNDEETIRPNPVTNQSFAAYNPTEGKLTETEDPMMDEPDGKKNKLRGIFRKVTRTFEKRTNIDATDDDDRLLIGGLAIRLK
jgi:anti-sigma factor RsiW